MHNQTAVSLYSLPDVPFLRRFQPYTEPDIPCQCYQRGVALPDSHCPPDFLWYHDSAEVVDSSHNTGCFHFGSSCVVLLFAAAYRYCLPRMEIYALAYHSDYSLCSQYFPQRKHFIICHTCRNTKQDCAVIIFRRIYPNFFLRYDCRIFRA